MITAGRTAVVAGAASIVSALVLALAAALGVELDADAPIFMVMLASTIVALVSAGVALRRRRDRRIAAAGIVMTIPALIVITIAAVFIVLLVTGEFQPS